MYDFVKNAGFRRLLLLFLLVFVFAFIFRSQLEHVDIDAIVVMVGNLIIFGASVLTLVMYGKAKKSKTSHGFTRNVYGAFVVKFFILLTAAMLYFYFAGEINAKAVFVCLGLYLLYHFLGASHAARVEKQQSHATHIRRH